MYLKKDGEMSKMIVLTLCILKSRRIDFFGPRDGTFAKTRKNFHNILTFNRMLKNGLSK